MGTTARLLLHCPDKQGILAEVTNFITINKGNIVYLDQYVDRVENVFFMRIEWELESFLIPKEKIHDYFATLFAQKYDMSFGYIFGCKATYGHFRIQDVSLFIRHVGPLHSR